MTAVGTQAPQRPLAGKVGLLAAAGVVLLFGVAVLLGGR